MKGNACSSRRITQDDRHHITGEYIYISRIQTGVYLFILISNKLTSHLFSKYYKLYYIIQKLTDIASKLSVREVTEARQSFGQGILRLG